MSEKYRLIKHNKNLAEIGNNEGLGLLFLVDEDCERKLRLIVDCLNTQQSTIEAKDKEIEESRITIQLYEADVSMRDNFLKSKGLYDEFLQCILAVNE